MLQASYTTVEGEETDKLPDIYFWNRNYYDDEGMYGVEGDKRFVYNLVTGHAVATPVVDGAYGVKVEKDYDYQGDYMAISYTDAAGTYHNALLDLPTGVVTPMDDYQSFDVHTQDSDGNYLCVVRNEGGGVFVVVVNADGSRRFEPVTISSTYGSSTQFWISSYESDTWSVYNWDGEEVAQFENPYTQPQTLEDRILYTVEEYDEETGTTGYSSYLINTETGEENEVPTAQNSTGEFTFQAHNVERARPEYYVAMQGYILTRDNEIVQFYIHK